MLRKVKDGIKLIANLYWLLTHKEELDKICEEITEAGNCFKKQMEALNGEKTDDMLQSSQRVEDS